MGILAFIGGFALALVLGVLLLALMGLDLEQAGDSSDPVTPGADGWQQLGVTVSVTNPDTGERFVGVLERREG